MRPLLYKNGAMDETKKEINNHRIDLGKPPYRALAEILGEKLTTVAAWFNPHRGLTASQYKRIMAIKPKHIKEWWRKQ